MVKNLNFFFINSPKKEVAQLFKLSFLFPIFPIFSIFPILRILGIFAISKYYKLQYNRFEHYIFMIVKSDFNYHMVSKSY